MIKIPKELLLEKIKEKSGLNDAQIKSKVKDKLDQLSGLISEEGALHIIANELGVKVLEEPGELKVKNVLSGMRNVELTAKVVKLYEVREFNKNDRKGKVGNFLIGDETGVMRIVAWNDKTDLMTNLKEGDVIKIQNGYSRENQGKTEVHLGDKTTVTIEKNAEIDVKPLTNERKTIKDLGENEQNVEIMGTVVQVFDPRFFAIDPETNKRAVEKEGQYYSEDKLIKNVDHSYVTNMFLDDGTENIRVVLWKNQTQRLFEKTHEEILKNQQSGFEEIKNELLGKIVKLTGRTNKNEMFDRVEFIAQFVDMNPDPEQELKRLNSQIDKAQENNEDKSNTSTKTTVETIEDEPATNVEQKESIAKSNVEKIQSDEVEDEEPETVSIDLEEKQETEVQKSTEPVLTNNVETKPVESSSTPTTSTTEATATSATTATNASTTSSIDKPSVSEPVKEASSTEDDLEELEEIDDIEELTDLDSI